MNIANTPNTNLALARKYRPNKFKDIVGQGIAKQILQNILHGNNTHHAYLLTGTRGVGKTTIARIIAKSLNCDFIKDSDPCCECDTCNMIAHGTFMDVIEIDAASNTGVDNIREVIENAKYIPTSAKYKVYIIDEVHMLSKSAFNALLKTLEEPPQYVIFILATTEINKIPITVLSRCLQIKLRNLTINEIIDHLSLVLDTEGVPFELPALKIIGKNANGSMRDALSLLDQAIAFCSSQTITTNKINEMLGNSEHELIYNMLDCIISLNGTGVVDLCQNIYNQGYNLEHFLEDLSQFFRDINIAQVTKYNNSDFKVMDYINKININNVQLYFEICNLGLNQIKITHDKYSIFVMTILRMLTFKIQDNSDVLNSNIATVASNITAHNINHQNQNTPNNNSTHTGNEGERGVNLPHTVLSNSLDDMLNFDWLDLVRKITTKLTHSAPFLQNSEFVSFTNNIFTIEIDSKYQDTWNKHAQNQITENLRNYFDNANIDIVYIFTENLTHTLKQENILQSEKNHRIALDVINSDIKLNEIIQTFGATVVPNSVKLIQK